MRVVLVVQINALKNGAKRTRTADPCNAIAVLYQLSYNPVCSVINCVLSKVSLSSFSQKNLLRQILLGVIGNTKQQ